MDLNNTLVVKNTYNAIAEEFSPLLSIENSSRAEVEFMDTFLEYLPRECDVVDLGCGAGKHGRYCASKGHRVTGFDISEKMIELAKLYNNKYEMKVLHVADICTVECDVKFDGVVAMYSLIHLTKDQTVVAINNLCKYLKPAAKIAITVYNGDRNGYYDEALRPELELKQFYRDYTRDELTNLFEAMGFKIENVQLWDDEDDITASNEDVEFGVIGLIATWQGERI